MVRSSFKKHLPNIPFKKSRIAFTVASLAVAMVGSSAVQAQPEGEPDTEADLIAETTSIQPGKPFTVAVRLKLERDWHIYWRNPGDSGMPTQISWDLPPGFHAGTIQWPVPERFVTAPLVSYGYENEIWLLTQITPPAKLPLDSPIKLGANVDWLACRDMCVPQRQNVSLRLQVAEQTPATDTGSQSAFASARAHLPIPAHQAGFTVRAELTVAKSDSKISSSPRKIDLRLALPAGLKISADRLKQAYFYGADEGTLTNPTSQQVVKEGNGYRIPLVAASDTPYPPKRLRGVLAAPKTTDEDILSQGLWIDVPVAATSLSPKR